MAYRVTDAIQGAATKLGRGAGYTFIATGGGTTSVICTTLTDKYEDDTPVDGTLIVVRDAGGASAAPEGEFGVISAYAQSSNTFTVPTMTAAVAAGDSIMFIKKKYPLEAWRLVLKGVLRDLWIKQEYSSITIVDGTEEYDVPVGQKFDQAPRLYIKPTASDILEPVPSGTYTIFPTAAGSAAKLRFTTVPDAGTLYFVYDTNPANVYAYSDVIHERLAPSLVEHRLAYEMLKWYGGRGNEALLARLASASEKAENKNDNRSAQTIGKTLTFSRNY